MTPGVGAKTVNAPGVDSADDGAVIRPTPNLKAATRNRIPRKFEKAALKPPTNL